MASADTPVGQRSYGYAGHDIGSVFGPSNAGPTSPEATSLTNILRRDTLARAGSRRSKAAARSCRMPREPLDTRGNLAKQRSFQVALGELQGEVPGMPNESPARLEEPLLEARERPVPDGDG